MPPKRYAHGPWPDMRFAMHDPWVVVCLRQICTDTLSAQSDWHRKKKKNDFEKHKMKIFECLSKFLNIFEKFSMSLVDILNRCHNQNIPNDAAQSEESFHGTQFFENAIESSKKGPKLLYMKKSHRKKVTEKVTIYLFLPIKSKPPRRWGQELLWWSRFELASQNLGKSYWQLEHSITQWQRHKTDGGRRTFAGQSRNFSEIFWEQKIQKQCTWSQSVSVPISRRHTTPQGWQKVIHKTPKNGDQLSPNHDAPMRSK